MRRALQLPTVSHTDAFEGFEKLIDRNVYIYYKYYIIICMSTLIDFAIREEYSRVKVLGDDLSEIESLINWDRFRILEPLIYKNRTNRGGRPNIDIVVCV